MDTKKAAWVVICMVLGAIFAGAIAEASGASHAIAALWAVLGCVLAAFIAQYVDRRKTN